MTVRHKQVLFGALAAAGAAVVALDASLFRPSEYPLAHKLFDGDWELWRNLFLGSATVLTAAFAYLTANVGKSV